MVRRGGRGVLIMVAMTHTGRSYIFLAGILMAVLLGGCQRSPAADLADTPAAPAPTIVATGTATVAPTVAPTALPTPGDETANPPADPTPPPAPASPSPTATPATETYAIQPGDTLLGLALARGVELSELQALNPDVRAEALQIGQQIIVPAAPQTAPVAAGTGASGSLTAGEPQVVALEQGVWVVGQVGNEGDLALAPAELTVTIRAADGAELTTATLWTAGRRIDPGGLVPYAIYLPGLDGDGATASLTVQPPGLAGAPQWPEISVEDLIVAEEDGATVISGRLVNAGVEAVTDLLLTITFYDPSGVYIGYRQSEQPETLAAGESLPIRLAALPVFSTVHSVEIQIDARAAE